MITSESKRVIPFRPHDAKSVGEGCFYLDQIIWLNGDQIELGDGVGFNAGCYVNGYGGLVIGDRALIGPLSMIHTANHKMDRDRPLLEQGWEKRPVEIGPDCWVGMGVTILPGAKLGEGCVIGAGSVVTKAVDPYAIAVGNPAKAVGERP